MAIKRALLLSCVLVAAAGLAAQAAPLAQPRLQPKPRRPRLRAPPIARRCSPSPHSGTAVPEGTTTGQRAEPLGDKLARADGVLCPPPGVDPEMHAPAPDTGKTPVIPPPGSPGGDPTIRPK